MAASIWKRITAVLDPGQQSDSDSDDEERSSLPVTRPDDEVAISFATRDILLNDGFKQLLETCAHDVLVDAMSFQEIERIVNIALAPRAKDIAGEIRRVEMQLFHDSETMSVAQDFYAHAPFDVFFKGDAIEAEGAVSAIYADFCVQDTLLKRITLNQVSEHAYPYRVADPFPVRPSTLTLFLKYAIRFLDGDQLLEPVGAPEIVRWPRTLGLTALIFDFMRSSMPDRRACATILAGHCNTHYRVPLELSAKLLDHMRAQKNPYYSSDFKIRLEFDSAPVGVSGTLIAWYF